MIEWPPRSSQIPACPAILIGTSKSYISPSSLTINPSLTQTRHEKSYPKSGSFSADSIQRTDSPCGKAGVTAEARMADQDVAYEHDKEREHQVASAGSASDNEEVGAVTINEGALLRKIDFRLLPAVGILYLLSFLDRSNVANARIEGLATDLGMSELVSIHAR